MMKPRILLILSLIVAIFLLASCSAKSFVCPNGDIVSSPDLCPQEKVEAPEKTVIKTPPSTAQDLITSEVEELLAKSSKVKSMSYEYKDSPLRTGSVYIIQVKDSQMKVRLPVTTGVINTNEIDTVILDTASKEAKSYCESLTYCIKQGRQENVEYSSYYKPTPLDLIKQIDSAKKVGEERIFDRNTWKVEVNGDQLYWIDTFYGVPIKVESTSGSGEYHSYENALFNQVRSIEFTERD